jgi:hypothetical protein
MSWIDYWCEQTRKWTEERIREREERERLGKTRAQEQTKWEDEPPIKMFPPYSP